MLTAGGVLAVWSYGLTRISPGVDALIDEFYTGEIEECWPPERAHVDAAYRTIPFPFEEIEAPDFAMSVDWTADDLVNYLRTWSSVQRCMASTGNDPVASLEDPLRRAFW